MPKFLASGWKRGFFFDLAALLAPKGAAAGFLPDPGLALGGWSLRRSQQCKSRKFSNAPRSSSASVYCYTWPSVLVARAGARETCYSSAERKKKKEVRNY